MCDMMLQEVARLVDGVGRASPLRTTKHLIWRISGQNKTRLGNRAGRKEQEKHLKAESLCCIILPLKVLVIFKSYTVSRKQSPV